MVERALADGSATTFDWMTAVAPESLLGRNDADPMVLSAARLSLNLSLGLTRPSVAPAAEAGQLRARPTSACPGARTCSAASGFASSATGQRDLPVISVDGSAERSGHGRGGVDDPVAVRRGEDAAQTPAPRLRAVEVRVE